MNRREAEQGEPSVGVREGTGAHSCGGKGMSTAPVALVLCFGLEAVFVMAPGAAWTGLQQQGLLPEEYWLLQCTLKST